MMVAESVAAAYWYHVYSTHVTGLGFRSPKLDGGDRRVAEFSPHDGRPNMLHACGHCDVSPDCTYIAAVPLPETPCVRRVPPHPVPLTIIDPTGLQWEPAP